MASSSSSHPSAGRSSARPLPPKAAQIVADAREALARRLGCQRLPAWPTGQMVEIAPGVTVAPLPSDDASRVVVVELEPQGNGLHRQVGRVRGRRVVLSRANLQALGIAAGYKVLRRLIHAGFIRGEIISLGVVQMDLESYFEHERATGDPEFWTRDNCANARRLRLAVAGTSLAYGADYERRKGTPSKSVDSRAGKRGPLS